MLDWLMTKMEQPPVFGLFHLLFFAAIIVFTVLLIVFFRKCNDRVFRRIVGICWGVVIVLEIMKEIIWGFSSGTWNYDWNSFPFQFCSLPYYFWPFVFILPESKYRDALNIFCGTFMFFAGFAYLFVCSSLCEYVFVNIQTLVHHGLQAGIGLFIFVHEYDKFNFKKFLQSISFLVFSVIMAILLNVIITLAGHHTNLFELNPMPGHETTALVFSDILKATNFPVYVLTYIVGFTVFATAVYFIFKYLIILSRKIANKAKENKTQE